MNDLKMIFVDIMPLLFFSQLGGGESGGFGDGGTNTKCTIL